MKRKASLHNLGCKVNAYETEAMQQLLEEAGYQIVPFGEPSDVCIINTCSVTNVADKKSRQMLHRARAKNPEAVIVAAGCYVQAASQELKLDGAADIIVGNNRKKEIALILEEHFKKAEQESACDPHIQEPVHDIHMLDISKTNEYEELRISRVSQHTRAMLKVQDGCNQFCSYCIIPYTRGRVRSRRPESILREVKTLAEAGCREVVLTGIHLSSYGIDFTDSHSPALLELIRSIHEIEGLDRIRLGSLEPRIITRSFAGELAQLPKVCPHFHLSLQSGCEATLKRMNRHYTPEEYLERCRILRDVFSNPAITTDVIVGFPGETEEEFAVTREYLENVRFYEMHVFKYSRRAGTRAASMPDQVPEEVKGRRSDILLELEKKMSVQYREAFIGQPITVLLEENMEINGGIYAAGYTREYVKAAVNPEHLQDWKGKILEGYGKQMLTPEIMELIPKNGKIG